MSVVRPTRTTRWSDVHRMDITQRMLTTYNDDLDLLKKVICIKSSHHPNGTFHKSHDQKNSLSSIKGEGIAPCFLRL